MKTKFKGMIIQILLFVCSIIPIYIRSRMSKKNIFLIYTPVHPNMGDQAIRRGEKKFFKSFFSGYSLIEIKELLWKNCKINAIKRIIRQKDLIMIHGGGYIGDLWMTGENDFKQIVESFPENKIVAFPNTAYYSDTKDGSLLLEDDKKFYEQYKNIVFHLRDKASYKLMCGMVGEKRCFYKPDMALILKPGYEFSRKDILFCIRKDHEKVQSAENIEKLKQFLEQSGFCVKYTDTVKIADRAFSRNQRKRDKVFEDTLAEFAGASLIITDRLHGMVLSAINKTPCIATDNISKKVSGVYEWIKHLDYIRVAKIEDIDADMIENLLKTKPVYDNDKIMNEFAEMADEIKRYWEN